MKPATTDDVLDLMDATFISTALGSALELGLFWLLDARPMDTGEIARALDIPPVRCSYWLQLLCRAGLLEEGANGHGPSPMARKAILKAYSRDAWALLAEEARDRLPGLSHLPESLHRSSPPSPPAGPERPPYITRMASDPGRARRFTRMLYELHQPLAMVLADVLDLRGASRLMDLGGGSGVISMGLARRHPDLMATVIDIATVCDAGREIATEHSLEDRVTYRPADFLRDELPSGFDVVLECDVNVYSGALFRKVRASLNPGGRFLVIDQFAPSQGLPHPSRLHWALEKSLTAAAFAFPTAAGIRDELEQAGFRVASERSLPPAPGPCKRFTEGLVLLDAHR
jgi:SAM-dependent methyltransferase